MAEKETFQKDEKPTSQQQFVALHKACSPRMWNHAEHFKDNSYMNIVGTRIEEKA